MFRKRTKRIFSEGTFIPLLPRSLAIAQLCLTFTVFITILTQPFLGDLYTIKSHLSLYDAVLAQPDKFTALDKIQKDTILQNQQLLEAHMALPLSKKIERSILLFTTSSPWLLAWILMSIILVVLLLRRQEGIIQAIWLIPLLATIYTVDNAAYGVKSSDNQASIFPTEKEVIDNYLKEPLSHNIARQYEQLQTAWQHYLIKQWHHEEPSIDFYHFKEQLSVAQFAFDVARLPKKSRINDLNVTNLPTKKGLPLLALFLLWNFTLPISVFFYRSRIS